MSYRTVVVGVDFTGPSLAAARWVATMFAPEAELVLAHVLPEPRVPSFLRAELPPTAHIAAAVAPALYGGLRGLADLVGGDRVQCVVLTGDPVQALAMVAEESGADLVCVGRGKRRRGSARFGATTPQRLLTRTRLPTLVVHRMPSGAPAHIVATVDERAGARHVLDVACRLAAPIEARVDALHVIEQEVHDFVVAARAALDPGDEAPPQRRRLAESAREWAASQLGDVSAGARAVTPVGLCGDAGEEIVRHARQSDADVIVIGRGGDASSASLPLGALPLGSTARFVLWAAPCPVLVLPLDATPRLLPAPGGRRAARPRTADVLELRASSRHVPAPKPPAARLDRRDVQDHRDGPTTGSGEGAA